MHMIVYFCMPSRRARHARLIALLSASTIESHEAIRRRLAEDGIEATQATISRDLREIGAIKTSRGYAMPGPAARAAAPAIALPPYGLAQAFRDLVTSIERAGSLIVIKTGIAQAPFVAAELDRQPPHQLLGTIAGDDTIFLACASESAAKRIAADLTALSAANARPAPQRASLAHSR